MISCLGHSPQTALTQFRSNRGQANKYTDVNAIDDPNGVGDRRPGDGRAQRKDATCAWVGDLSTGKMCDATMAASFGVGVTNFTPAIGI